MIGNFKNGIRNGDWTYWHENGMKRLEGSYLNGFKNGLWTRWYGNGVIATKYIYDNSAPNGKITEWHIDKECWDKKGMECECGPSWWDDCEDINKTNFILMLIFCVRTIFWKRYTKIFFVKKTMPTQFLKHWKGFQFLKIC